MKKNNCSELKGVDKTKNPNCELTAWEKIKKKINEDNCGVVSTLESDVKTLQDSKIPAGRTGKDLNPTIRKYCHFIKKTDWKPDQNTSTSTSTAQ